MSRARPGDVIARRKGLVMHKGVVLADGRVLHNTPFRGEHVTSQTEFRAGRRLYVEPLEQRGRRVPHSHEVAHQGRSYNLLTNNCEHTVNRFTTGRAHSPQLRSWVVGAGMAAVAFAVTRHPGAAAAAYAAGRGWFGRWSERR